jgi:hypothetical protein
MKKSLGAIVAAVRDGNVNPPIIIIIDELDRCRPSYALKLFEEIKHLFDVHGLVFVLGMNGEQLAHSVSGTYGANFDGAAYLRRFINRRYTLEPPNFGRLVASVTKELSASARRLFLPPIKADSLWTTEGPEYAQVIARYMKTYGLPARAAYDIADILQTCLYLTEPAHLHLVYLLPLIIGHLNGLRPGQIPEPEISFDFAYGMSGSAGSASTSLLNPLDVARRFRDLTAMSRADFINQYNQHADDYPEQAVMESMSGGQTGSMASARNYPRLVEKVGRFKNPQLDAGNSSQAQPKA